MLLAANLLNMEKSNVFHIRKTNVEITILPIRYFIFGPDFEILVTS